MSETQNQDHAQTMLEIASDRVGALSTLSRTARVDIEEAPLGSGDPQLLADVRDAVADKLMELDRECERIAKILSRASVVTGSEAGAEVSEGLRLIVSQMAEAGHTRGEIVERLGRDFGVDAPERVVAQVLD